MDSLPLAANLGNKFRGRPRTRVVEPSVFVESSSENSVSVEASHSEDEMQIVRADSSDDESLSGAESGKSEDQENVQINSSGGYIETHSDSDADEERSGNEENGVSEKKPRRRVLRRKKNQAPKPALPRSKEGKFCKIQSLVPLILYSLCSSP